MLVLDDNSTYTNIILLGSIALLLLSLLLLLYLTQLDSFFIFYASSISKDYGGMQPKLKSGGFKGAILINIVLDFLLMGTRTCIAFFSRG